MAGDAPAVVFRLISQAAAGCGWRELLWRVERSYRVEGLRRVLPLFVLLAPGVAAAQTLEILGPGAGPVPPDGFTIALLKRSAERSLVPLSSPQVSADGADLRAGPPSPPLSTFLVVPRPGAKEIRVQASDSGAQVEARFPVGPPGSRVELSLEPAAPVKGRDKEAVLRVRVRAADGSPDRSGSPPVLRANVGKLGAVESVGPGEFKARYLLPETRYPEVVVIAALEPWPHPQSIHGTFGRLLVPLATAFDLSGTTEPEAQYSLEIAGKRFGPVEAGPDGKFKMPVVAPPGYKFGKGMAVDKAGNKRPSQLDLRLPPTDQLSCVLNPARLPADGVSRSRVLCAVCDVYGQPVPSAHVQLTASRGQVSAPRAVEGGMLEWIYTAPRKLSAEPDVLTAVFRQGGAVSRDELQVEVVQGPVATAAVVPAESYAHLGGKLPLEVVVEDALDRARPGAALEVRASAGTVSAPREKAPGRWAATWSAPKEGTPAPAELFARAYGPSGADPARIATWIRDGRLFVGVTDLAGLPLPRQPLLVGDRQLVTGDDGSADVGKPAPGRLELTHKQWPGLRLTAYVLDDGQTVYPASSPVGEAVARRSVELYPAVPVNVRIKIDGRSVTYWVESAEGDVLPGRDVRVSLSSGTRSQGTTAEGRTTFKVEGGGGPVTVSVADAATWVTAVAEVQR